MHIKYFGDVLWSIGMALIAGSLPAAVIPAVVSVVFGFLLLRSVDGRDTPFSEGTIVAERRPPSSDATVDFPTPPRPVCRQRALTVSFQLVDYSDFTE